MRRVNREAAEERAKQQQQSTIEEFNQHQSSENSEISEEGLENE